MELEKSLAEHVTGTRPHSPYEGEGGFFRGPHYLGENDGLF